MGANIALIRDMFAEKGCNNPIDLMQSKFVAANTTYNDANTNKRIQIQMQTPVQIQIQYNVAKIQLIQCNPSLSGQIQGCKYKYQYK